MKTKITNRIARKKFYEYLRDCNKRSHPNENEISYIVQKLDLHNVSQIIFDYGEANMRCIFDFFISVEYYEFCAILRDRIETHNKVSEIRVEL